jgi:hypothetical protein
MSFRASEMRLEELRARRQVLAARRVALDAQDRILAGQEERITKTLAGIKHETVSPAVLHEVLRQLSVAEADALRKPDMVARARKELWARSPEEAAALVERAKKALAARSLRGLEEAERRVAEAMKAADMGEDPKEGPAAELPPFAQTLAVDPREAEFQERKRAVDKWYEEACERVRNGHRGSRIGLGVSLDDESRITDHDYEAILLRGEYRAKRADVLREFVRADW